ncbi:MAG: GDP-mannose 4,6-dehydratase [Patescibacteria group bacterium]|nr:GDP-mannose 4,6-dehydratase [Patescibacteria group bacterium]
MKVLITGAAGFIGSHLCSYLLKQGVNVVGTWHKREISLTGVKRIKTDLLNKEEVKKIILQEKPDYIFHLAGKTLVMPSWENPQETFLHNIFPILNILDAVQKTQTQTRILVFGSSSEYETNSKSINEYSKLGVNSPYAVSKIIQDYLGLLYFIGKKTDVVRIRPFFIIGSGKTCDVVTDFSQGIINIEKGKQDTLKVGNLKAVRDFLDIDDAVKAIWVIAQRGKSGEVYNLCSGQSVIVGDLLKKLIRLSGKKIKVMVDPKLFRPIDEIRKVGNNQKLKQLGWKPTVSLDKSLKKILDHQRSMQ